MVSEVGAFLRSRRARLSPSAVGLPDRGQRRVPGLRREEVAQLAGVSTDYLVRLEQGRATHVSEQVLAAIGRALRLDSSELSHLRDLAQPPRPSEGTSSHVRRSLQLMLSAQDGPALITDFTMTVIASNDLANATFLITDDPRTRDRARQFFLGPSSREFFPEWEDDAESIVAELRVQTGRRPNDPALTAMVGELSIKSEPFRSLWARHPVRDKTHGVKTIRHPVVGRLELSYDRLVLADAADTALYVYSTEPGSETAERLAVLASWTATAAPAPSPRIPGENAPSQ